MYSSLSAPRAFLGVVVLSLVLTGCAAGGSSVAEPQPSSPSSSPVAEPVVTPAPPSLFPLDCEELVPGDARQAAMGETMTRDPESISNAFGLAVERQRGGLYCSWESAGSTLTVNLNRNAALYVAETEPWFTGGNTEKDTLGADSSQFHCNDVDYSSKASCAATAILGDYHLFGYMTEKGGAADPLPGRSRTLLVDAIARLSAAPVPAPWSAPAGSWPLLADCEGIETAGGVAAALGNPGLTAERAGGVESPVLSPEYDAIGGSTICWWSGGANDPADLVQHATVTVLAGGAWYWDEPAPESEHTVTEVEVDGTDDAAVRCDAYGCSLDARVGNNAFQVSSGYMATPLTEQQLVDAAHAVVVGILSTVTQ